MSLKQGIRKIYINVFRYGSVSYFPFFRKQMYLIFLTNPLSFMPLDSTFGQFVFDEINIERFRYI